MLQGDHSHKIAKLVHSGGTRAFEGLYTLMNGYGQVVGFWFTHGTTLEELEPMLRGVARRYKDYGFNGPLLFTTDRCCDERKFWVGDKSSDPPTAPIFEALAREGVDALEETEISEAQLTLDPAKLRYVLDANSVFTAWNLFVRFGQFRQHFLNARQGAASHVRLVQSRAESDEIRPRYKTSRPSSISVQALTAVDAIIRLLDRASEDDKVMAVDCEWKVGAAEAHVVQIGLLDGRWAA